MPQYTTGTVDVTSGIQAVTGTDTVWSTLTTPAYFKIDTDGAPTYEVSAFNSDTVLTLSANYSGSSDEDLDYQIVTDFSPNYDWYLPYQGDRDAADHLRKFIVELDTKIKSLDDRITALEP